MACGERINPRGDEPAPIQRLDDDVDHPGRIILGGDVGGDVVQVLGQQVAARKPIRQCALPPASIALRPMNQDPQPALSQTGRVATGRSALAALTLRDGAGDPITLGP